MDPSLGVGLRSQPSSLQAGPPSAPGPVQQLHLGQPLGDHGGKDQPKEDTADQHVVIVILEHIKLLGGVHTGLEDVQPVGYNLQGGDQELGMQLGASKPQNDPHRVNGKEQCVMGVTEVPAMGWNPSPNSTEASTLDSPGTWTRGQRELCRCPSSWRWSGCS